MERIAALLMVIAIASCATTPRGMNANFHPSTRSSGATTLDLSRNDGFNRWPAADEAKVVALWKSIAAEKCGDKRLRISDGPFAIELLDHCAPYPGTSDCGFVSVSGDFLCDL